MIDLALGALLGLGLFVLVSGSPASRLAARLTPHIRDVGLPPSSSTVVDNPAVRVLALLALVPRALLSRGSRRGRTRSAVSDELPAVLDLLGLCVSTGLTIPHALERIAVSGRGILPDECRQITAEIGLGVSVSDALHASEVRVGHVGWSRLIEHLDIARRHGTPLIDIIRSLAADEQHAAGQRLLESASARETLMMFPLVFLILPVTVIMAIFPGITALTSISL
jgi:tight adherence protein C